MVVIKKLNLRDRLDDCTLDLSMMDMEEVPVKDIALIKKGTHLDLSMNKITDLGPGFAILTHLTKLDLSKNLLTSLPENFGDLVLLKHLDLYSNRLTHLPLTLGKLKALRWLDLKDNQLLPVLAEKAGDCLDPKQCQACARTMVAFLADMKQQVDETQLALEKKQEEALKKEEELKQKEEISKTKKKKAAKAKVDKKKDNGVKNSQPAAVEKRGDLLAGVKPVVKSAKKANKQETGRSWCGSFSRVLFWLVISAVLTANCLLLLYAIDKPTFVAVETYSNKVWSSFVKILPPQVSEPVLHAAAAAQPKIQEAWKQLVYVSVQMTHRVQDVCLFITKNEYYRLFVAHGRNIWDAIYKRVFEMYRSMSSSN